MQPSPRSPDDDRFEHRSSLSYTKPEESVSEKSNPLPRGLRSRVLIFVALFVVLVMAGALAAFLFSRPPTLPTSWTAITTSAGVDLVYYLHWENTDGQLRGSMEMAYYDSALGSIQTIVFPFIGIYHADSKRILLTFDAVQDVRLGDAEGIIENGTLQLRSTSVEATAAGGAIFRPGSFERFQQLKNNLGL